MSEKFCLVKPKTQIAVFYILLTKQTILVKKLVRLRFNLTLPYIMSILESMKPPFSFQKLTENGWHSVRPANVRQVNLFMRLYRRMKDGEQNPSEKNFRIKTA